MSIFPRTLDRVIRVEVIGCSEMILYARSSKRSARSIGLKAVR